MGGPSTSLSKYWRSVREAYTASYATSASTGSGPTVAARGSSSGSALGRLRKASDAPTVRLTDQPGTHAYSAAAVDVTGSPKPSVWRSVEAAMSSVKGWEHVNRILLDTSEGLVVARTARATPSAAAACSLAFRCSTNWGRL